MEVLCSKSIIPNEKCALWTWNSELVSCRVPVALWKSRKFRLVSKWTNMGDHLCVGILLSLYCSLVEEKYKIKSSLNLLEIGILWFSTWIIFKIIETILNISLYAESITSPKCFWKETIHVLFPFLERKILALSFIVNK